MWRSDELPRDLLDSVFSQSLTLSSVAQHSIRRRSDELHRAPNSVFSQSPTLSSDAEDSRIMRRSEESKAYTPGPSTPCSSSKYPQVYAYPSLRNRGQRRSKEYPVNFALKTKLRQACSEFLHLYERRRRRLKDIQDELRWIKVENQRNKEKAIAMKIKGTAFSVLGGLAGIAAAPFTGGLSLAAMGLGVACGGAAVVGVGSDVIHDREKRQNESQEDSLSTEFRSIIQSLTEKLEEVKKATKELLDKCNIYSSSEINTLLYESLTLLQNKLYGAHLENLDKLHPHLQQVVNIIKLEEHFFDLKTEQKNLNNSI